MYFVTVDAYFENVGDIIGWGVMCGFGIMCGIILFLFVAARWCTGLLTASIERAPRPAEGAAGGGQRI